jgi:DNA replication and repair protein RecF
MNVVSVGLRNFRCYERAAAPLGGGLTVVWGPNGAGKSNLLEAIYFGCTGRSCRTNNDRELIRFGADATRVEVAAADRDGGHQLTVAFAPGEAKRMTVDGAPVERLLDSPTRPLVSVFLPDRLELVKGVPALRRAHIDQFVAALWPTRIANRRAYNQTLAQRNALLMRARAGVGSRSGIDAWDQQLALHAVALMADRAEAVARVLDPFAQICGRLGLDGEPTISYRPRSRAQDAAEFQEELGQRIETDLERGFTSHGPHRDDLLIMREGRELRTYGSQGQQRLGLLSLLLAERVVIAEERSGPPLMLLDDVMSELDSEHRAALVEVLCDGGGQALITTTDLDHVPGAGEPGVARIEVSSGNLLEDVVAGAKVA